MTTVDVEAFVARCREEGIECAADQPLATSTTYAVGGRARVAVTVRSREELLRLAGVTARFPGIPTVVLGRGSNTLVADSGFDGLVVVMATGDEARAIGVDGDRVIAAGAMLMPVLARRSVQAGRGGLEWCVGIPGTVGGALRMNAGGHGAEMVDSVVQARVVSLKSGADRVVDAADLGLHFRGSALAAHHVVVAVGFATTDVDPAAGAVTIDEIVSWRREHQPGGRNAGSVFVNPAPGSGSAGALIDSLGLRGLTVGGASVSEKHANFIQASDSATAADIIAVMSRVQDAVAQEHGVVLRSEVRLVGFDDATVARFGDETHASGVHLDQRRRLCAIMGEST